MPSGLAVDVAIMHKYFEKTGYTTNAIREAAPEQNLYIQGFDTFYGSTSVLR